MRTGEMVRAVGAGTALVLLGAACGGNGNDLETTQSSVAQASDSARSQAEDAFASLRTDAERFVDQIRTRNSPEIKQELLKQCRDIEERLRKADSPDAGRVDKICNRIRDTDPSDDKVWSDIRKEINELRPS